MIRDAAKIIVTQTAVSLMTINECNHNFRFYFTYVHELQHLLYALHIDSNLKI